MTLTVTLSGSGSEVYTETVYQHDRNATLVFEGTDLPEEYEVHFGIGKERGISVICKGDAEGVKIPDALLSTGDYIYGWVYDASEATGMRSIGTVIIPVIPRPVPIPSQNGSSSGSGTIKYEINEDDENLTFLGTTANRLFSDNIIEEEH